MEHLTKESFKNKVFDFESNQEWSFAGDKPCIIDFYADWCNPCKVVAPILENLAEEYEGKVDIYKVDTEKEQELASMFNIRSIPSILFVPKDGKRPQLLALEHHRNSLEPGPNQNAENGNGKTKETAPQRGKNLKPEFDCHRVSSPKRVDQRNHYCRTESNCHSFLNAQFQKFI